MPSQLNSNVRRRGVTLTAQGSIKLSRAIATAEMELNFKRYTLEALSEEIGLTPTTLSKVFTGSCGVDKRTLECCFRYFSLTLSTEDYLYLKSEPDNFTEIKSTIPEQIYSFIKPVGDRPNTSLAPKMDRIQTDAQPLFPTTIPGGQIPLNSVQYIDRPILESLCYETIGQPGTMLNIRAPKQMGKTSLMTRILAYAKTQGAYTVALSLQLAEAKILQNLESCLKWFSTRVSKQLGMLQEMVDGDNLGTKSKVNDYFEDVLLVKIDRSLVIAIDELHQLFAYPDIACEFLLLLRTWTEQAKARLTTTNPWCKLRLVTVHSTEILLPAAIDPALLNTGLVIELPELTLAQVQDLAHRCGQEIAELQSRQLITLVGGHPYRLQLAFYYLQQQTITLEQLLENSELTLAIYSEHLQQQWWNLQRYPNLCPVFKQIVRQPSWVDCDVQRGYQLQQLGLVHLQGSQARLACELFRPFFDKLLQPLSS